MKGDGASVLVTMLASFESRELGHHAEIRQPEVRRDVFRRPQALVQEVDAEREQEREDQEAAAAMPTSRHLHRAAARGTPAGSITRMLLNS